MQSFVPVIGKDLIDDVCAFVLRWRFLTRVLLNIDPVVKVVSSLYLCVDALGSLAIPTDPYQVALLDVVVPFEFCYALLISVLCSLKLPKIVAFDRGYEFFDMENIIFLVEDLIVGQFIEIGNCRSVLADLLVCSNVYFAVSEVIVGVHLDLLL